MPHTLYEHLSGVRAKVLIVENEAIIALRIQEMVDQLGHTVVGVAASGEEALQLGSTSIPDIVLMDIRLDGALDGIETAAKIRALWGTPVVFMSAHSDKQTLKRARTTEPLGFIIKPFSSTDVSVCIHFALQHRDLQIRLHENEAWTGAFLDSAPGPALAENVDGQVHAINKATEELTGWQASSAAGKRLDELLQLENSDDSDSDIAGCLIGPNGHRHKVSGFRKTVCDGAKILGRVFIFHPRSEGELDERG